MGKYIHEFGMKKKKFLEQDRKTTSHKVRTGYIIFRSPLLKNYNNFKKATAEHLTK